MSEVFFSPHFTLFELTRSQTALRLGIPNKPTPAQIDNLMRLCNLVLEPSRALLGVSLHVDSGFRSPELNKAVGGAPNSAHPDGRAGDVIPMGLSLQTAFTRLRESLIPFDQLILECDAWLHLSVAPVAFPARRECLLASGGPGHWQYSKVSNFTGALKA